MDIKLHNDTFQLEVFNGDSLESLTSKILVRHELPYERFDRIANLIGNALKFKRADTAPRITIGATTVEEAGRSLVRTMRTLLPIR